MHSIYGIILLSLWIPSSVQSVFLYSPRSGVRWYGIDSAGVRGSNAPPVRRDATRPAFDTLNKRDTVDYVITDHRSILFYPAGRWGIRRSKSICTEFVVSPLKMRVDTMLVTSTGLGTVHLWRGDPARDLECPRGAGANPLTISDIDRPTIIRARIGPVDLPKGFKAFNGSVTVSVPGSKRVELPISIQERSPSRFATATLWFLGVLVPALLGAFIGYVAKVLSDKKQAAKLEQENFYTFIAGDGGTQVKRLFENFYPSVIHLVQPGSLSYNPVTFCRELRDELRERHILTALPRADRDELLALLDSANHKQVQTKLSALFPLYAPLITDATQPLSRKE